MYKIEDKQDLRDFCSTTLLGSAYGFKEQDFLTAKQQLNIERAFTLLHGGVEDYYQTPRKKNKRMHNLLKQSFTAFKAGDNKKGAEYIRAFEEEIT
jgi:hypothetical protein